MRQRETLILFTDVSLALLPFAKERLALLLLLFNVK